MLIKAKIVSFAVDSQKNIPIVLLKEESGEKTIPIPMGTYEASAIAINYLNIGSDRPLTIDLAMLILLQLGGVLNRIVIYDFSNQIFYANIQILANQSNNIIDCRACDAIALALRCKCDIFVEDSVFEKIRGKEGVSDKEKLRRDIANINTLDFGKYYLK